MFKPRLTFICLNLAAVCALLGLSWYQTHGGPPLVSKQGLVFAMLAVSPLTSILYGVFGCRPCRGQA